MKRKKKEFTPQRVKGLLTALLLQKESIISDSCN